ncbi:hypothetical protein M426DRAFT_77581 [Hypoxylon sp. CI-4A]|nr:hypothetical protein M426DRAFT_77581 [Hypoxylon sp. CI-4A]
MRNYIAIPLILASRIFGVAFGESVFAITTTTVSLRRKDPPPYVRQRAMTIYTSLPNILFFQTYTNCVSRPTLCHEPGKHGEDEPSCFV